MDKIEIECDDQAEGQSQNQSCARCNLAYIRKRGVRIKIVQKAEVSEWSKILKVKIVENHVLCNHCRMEFYRSRKDNTKSGSEIEEEFEFSSVPGVGIVDLVESTSFETICVVCKREIKKIMRYDMKIAIEEDAEHWGLLCGT